MSKRSFRHIAVCSFLVCICYNFCAPETAGIFSISTFKKNLVLVAILKSDQCKLLLLTWELQFLALYCSYDSSTEPSMVLTSSTDACMQWKFCANEVEVVDPCGLLYLHSYVFSLVYQACAHGHTTHSHRLSPSSTICACIWFPLACFASIIWLCNWVCTFSCCFEVPLMRPVYMWQLY